MTRSTLGLPTSVPGKDGDESRLLYALPHVFTQPSRPFGIYWCDKSRSGFLYPSPTDTELAAFYSPERYTDYLTGRAPTADSVHRRTVGEKLIDKIVFTVARLRGDGTAMDASRAHRILGEKKSRILDIGCASGHFLASLKALGHDVVGIEPSEAARKEAHNRGLTVIAGSGEQIPEGIEPNSFDLVSMFHVLEHARDPRKVLENCRALLRPDGWLVCEVPNHASIGFRMRGPCWFHTDAGRHIQFLSNDSLSEMVRAAGFSRWDISYNGYSRQFTWLPSEQGVWDALYASVANSLPFGAPRRPRKIERLALLARTILASPRRAYDSVMVIARA